jgi:excisionase family DNA binding protein
VRVEDEKIVGADWLGSTDAAAVLGATPRTVYRWIDEGDRPTYRMGRVIRFKRVDIDAFIESSRIQPGTITYLYPDTTGDRDVG